MAKVNLTGKSPTVTTEKVKLENKARMNATMESVKMIAGTDFTTGLPNSQIVFEYKTDDGKVLSQWMNPVVTKGSEGKNKKIFSNSRLYDLLLLTKTMEPFQKIVGDNTSISDDDLIKFLEENLVKVKFEIEIKNRKKNTPDEYSAVGDIIRVLK